MATIYYRLRSFYRRVRAFLGKGFVYRTTRVVVHDPDDVCRSPIFIIGTHRSGTSLLRRILDSHKSIACPPESFFLSHYTPLLRDDLTFVGLTNLGFEREKAIKGLRSGATYFHEAYRRAKQKPRWADKTPQYSMHLETLHTLFGDDARFLFIFRHPFDVAFSIWQRGWEFHSRTGDALVDTCEYVRDAGLRQLDFIKQHPHICGTMYYDQLIDFPEQTLRRICTEFLDEPWDPNMLKHDRMVHDCGTEDPMVRGRPGFRGSFENWKAWHKSQTEQAGRILAPLMDRLGYSPDSAHRRQEITPEARAAA